MKYFQLPIESIRTYAIYIRGQVEPIEIDRNAITILDLKEDNTISIVEKIKDEESGTFEIYRTLVNCGEISYIKDEH